MVTIMKKLALITGIDVSSIARYTCKKILQEGYDVVVTYESKYFPGSQERDMFEHELEGYSVVAFEQADFRNKESINDLIDRLKKYRFDVIVNCPAILATTDEGGLKHEFYHFDYDMFNTVIQYNITAIAAICIGLKDNVVAGGCIVNVTSSAAEEGAFATISYNASKAAVKNLTKSLANNFGGYNGVRVNSVAPGWIPQSSDVVEENIVALATALTPAKDRGKPENVVNAVLSFVNNPFATGSNYEVDGGLTSSYLMYLIESLELRGLPTNDTIRELVKLINGSKDKLGNADNGIEGRNEKVYF